MTRKELLFAIENALIYDVDDEGYTDGIVETILDGVIRTLQRDPRFPRLTRGDYDLLFADVAKEAREALLPYWKIDTELAAKVIGEAVIDVMDEEDAPHECRENSEADQAAVVEQRR